MMTTCYKDMRWGGPMQWGKTIPAGNSSKCSYCSIQGHLRKFQQHMGYKQMTQMIPHKILDYMACMSWSFQSRQLKNSPADMAQNH
jgi:hypothetical protein